MSRRIDICPTCKGKGEIIVDNWLTEGMTEEEIAKEKEKALADIVEVVRCQDCKESEVCPDTLLWCNQFERLVPPMGFCHCGERSENGK